MKVYGYPRFVQETSVTGSWWSVLMLMSQQLAALIPLALLAFINPLPPHPPIPLLKLLRASLILILQTHLTVFIDFTILNIYRSHFPKPSMFIQHLGDHSPAPFSIPPPLAHPCYTHTQTLVFSFSLFLSSLPRPPSSLYYIPPLYVPLPG